MESHIDFGFKKEANRLYAVGYFLRKQMLNIESNKVFEKNALMLNEIFI